jgi:hypothetical protein
MVLFVSYIGLVDVLGNVCNKLCREGNLGYIMATLWLHIHNVAKKDFWTFGIFKFFQFFSKMHKNNYKLPYHFQCATKSTFNALIFQCGQKTFHRRFSFWTFINFSKMSIFKKSSCLSQKTLVSRLDRIIEDFLNDFSPT